MSTTTFIKSAIERGDNLFAQIYGFNQLISKYVEPSHIAPFPDLAQYWNVFRKINRIQKKLSVLLLKYFKLENKFFYSFDDPRLRIALLDSKTLSNLLLYAGAVLYSERISKIILKNDLLLLKDSIGDDIYFFSTKKASLLTGFAPKVNLSTEKVIDKNSLFEGGKECLQMCLAQEDQALTDRLILKFPKNIAWNFNSPVSEEQKTKAWNFLYKILIKEVNSEVKKCFI